MSTVYSKDGSTYTTGGITYDASTGRPVTPDGGFLLEAEKKSEINNSTKGQASAKSQRRGGVLRYPLEALTGTTDYLQINIIEYKRQPNQLTRPAGFAANTLNSAVGGTSSGSLARKSVINDGSILLQVPSNVQDGNAVNFGDSSMNTLVGAAAGVVGNVMKEGGDALANMKET